MYLYRMSSMLKKLFWLTKHINYPNLHNLKLMNEYVEGFHVPILDKVSPNLLMEFDNRGVNHRRYNPSILSVENNQIIVFLRKSNRYFYKFIPFLGPIENIQASESASAIDYLVLDYDLNIIREGQSSTMGLDPNIEDLRPNCIDQNFYGLGSFLEVKSDEPYARSVLVELGTFEGIKLNPNKKIYSLENQINKNFTWIQGSSQFITRIKPFQFGTDMTVNTGGFLDSDFRAGTNFVRLDSGRRIGIVRTSSKLPSLQQIYLHQFVILNDSTNKTQFSRKFSLTNHGISICNGLALTDDHVFLSWGYYDQKAFIAKWDRSIILDLFDPVKAKRTNLLVFLYRDIAASVKAFKSTKSSS